MSSHSDISKQNISATGPPDSAVRSATRECVVAAGTSRANLVKQGWVYVQRGGQIAIDAWNRLKCWLDSELVPSSDVSAKKPYKLNAIQLEDRILYSASPLLAVLGEGESPEVDSLNSNDISLALDELVASLLAATSEELQPGGDLGISTTNPLEHTLGSQKATEPATLSGEDDAAIDALATTQVEHRTQNSGMEVVFVQSGLLDSDQLLADLEANTLATDRQLVIVVLSGSENGFDQVDSVLSQYSNLDAIHFVSHGSDGTIQIGGSWLTAGNIDLHSEQLRSWGMSLSESGDILIYGCDVAAGPEGQAFIDTVAALTGADVAASTNKTGDLSRGGDWSLEYVSTSSIVEQLSSTVHEQSNSEAVEDNRSTVMQTVEDKRSTFSQTIENNRSTIETRIAFGIDLQESYGGLLATYTVTNTNDSGAGSLRQAITDANNNAGTDTIAFSVGSGVISINLTSGLLPTINGTVIIDGWSQPGFTSTPIVVIDGGSLIAAGDGLLLSSSADNSTIRGLVIRDFNGDGIQIDSGSDGNTIVGNYIGSYSTSGGDLGSADANSGNGINVLGANNTIGGTTDQNRNVIGGNLSNGIRINGSVANSNTVLGNYIGTTAAGNVAMGNSLNGIQIDGGPDNTTIGGTNSNARNIIAASGQNGIFISDEGSDSSVIRNNYIGLGADGIAVLGNSGDGIFISGGGDNTIIGGANMGNVILGNRGNAIEIDGGSVATIIQGNSIGINLADTVVHGSGLSGILIENGATNTTIGGINNGEKNIITDSGLMSASNNAGIQILGASTGNSIIGNSIYANGGIGIDLGTSGITANDTGDSDTGPNNLQNNPLITAATVNAAGTTVTVSGSINSVANVTGLLLHFYATPSTGNVNARQGRRYLNSTLVNTDGSGNATFTNVNLSGFSGTVAAGEIITATATTPGANGNTSEFSLGFVATSTAGNVAPSTSQIVTTIDSGLTLNTSDYSSYLQAEDGDAILGGRTQLSMEFQFRSNPISSDGAYSLVSYATPTNGDALYIGATKYGATERLFFIINGSTVSFDTDIDAIFDGNEHSLTATWHQTNGAYAIYVDGTLLTSGTGLASSNTIASDGQLAFGVDLDSGSNTWQRGGLFRGTFNDIRIFSDVRTAIEIAASYRSNLPYNEGNLIANWRMDDLSTELRTTNTVSGNELLLRTITAPWATSDTPYLSARLDENTATGTLVGQVQGIDVERESRISALLAADTSLRYNAETGKFYKLVTGSSMNWSTAQTSAIAQTLNGVAGQLATIHSAGEQAFIASMNTSSAFLGGSDSLVEGEWRWYDGTTPSSTFWRGTSSGCAVDDAYTYFDAGDPDDFSGNQDSLIITSTGEWDDINSSQTRYWVQWNADDVLDATNTLTFTITSQTVAGAFAINSDSGVMTVANGSLLNFEVQTSHTITVRTTDGSGASVDRNYTIAIINLTEENNAPSDLSSGINLNNDGGNNAYLMTSSGGSVFGGRTQFTVETTFSGLVAGTNHTLISYFAGSDQVELHVMSDNTLYIEITGIGVTTANTYSQLTNGSIHSVAISWDNTAGDLVLYLDGQRVESWTGRATGATIAGGGTLTIGNEQDSLGGNFTTLEAFRGTLHDVRVWDRAISSEQISLNYQQVLGSSETGLIANWRMNGISGGTTVVDSVGGVNLSLANVAVGGGFTASTTTAGLSVNENATLGTRAGQVIATDPDIARDIVQDGLFREAAHPWSFLQYSAGQTFGNWTVRKGIVDLIGTYAQSTPLGGLSVDLDGAALGAIYQTLTTEIGKQYQVVFAMGGNFLGGEDVMDLRVTAAGETRDFSVTEPAGWSLSNMLFSNRSFTFTADSTSTTLDFQTMDNIASHFSVMIGDVRVIEIPQAVQAVLSNDPTLSYDAATGKFYRLVSTLTQPLAAITAATSSTLNGVSGQLATIRSAYENELIRAFAQQVGGDVLLGGRDATTEGNWRFLNGATESEQFSAGSTAQAGYYTNWRASEPNGSTSENQLAIRPDGQWQDVPDNQSRAYVVEWDASEVLSNFRYSITSDPSGAFAINANTGEITVTNATPLHEIATDPSITIQVTDAAGNSYSEAFTIAINRVNDNTPIITSNGGGATASISVAENTTAVTTLTATDADLPASTLTYSIVGGADAPLFSISSTTGALSFIAGRNFESPADTGGNNIYDVLVRVDDGLNFDEQAIAVTITNAQEAPVLDIAGTMTLNTITEDQTTNSGQTVASIISSAGGDRITDADSGAVEGIAVNSWTAGNGTWQYSLNGTTWTDIGTVSDVSALLLRSSDFLRFVPNGQNETNASIQFRAWDQTGATAGQQGTKVNAASNGGTTPFSTDTEVASITVTAVNDAPLLDSAGTMNLTSITEDQADNSGQTVDSIITSAGGDRITDVDNSAVEGIAITALSNGNGSWEYSLDGTNWISIGSVADNSALLLRSTDFVRFVPNGIDGTTANFTFRAWDQSSGTYGTKVNASTNGGSTAFSSTTETASIVVSSLPDAATISNLAGDRYDYSAGAGAIVIEQGNNAVVADVDSANFDTGNLTVSIASGGSSSEDRLAVRNQGTGVGQIGVSGSNITYSGTIIGTVSGGTSGTPLVVTLNANANPTSVTALVKNITFQNTNASSPVTGSREIRFTLNDGDGATSQEYDTTINIAGANTATILDRFSSTSYGNNDGTQNWSNSWTELGESNGSTSGFVEVDSSTKALEIGSGSTLLLFSSDITGFGARRTADLSTAMTASVSLDVWKSGISSNGSLTLAVSTNGTTWTNLNTFNFSSLSTNRTTFTYDISAYASSTTSVRLLGAGSVGGFLASGYFYADNIGINYVYNTAPVITLPGSQVNYTENDAATVIDATAVVTDLESPNFSGGQLTIDFSAGGAAEDRLAIRNQGTGAGQIGISGSNVTYGGITIGTFTGGTSGSSPLVISFNTNATATIVQAVARNITYFNTSDDPSTTIRQVRFGLTDGDGGTSSFVSESITVARINDAPVLDNTATMTLTSITEDQTNNVGQTVASIITSAGGDRITDADSGATEGIAITSLNSGSGKWQYSIDGGTVWLDVGAVSNNSALLLRSTDKIRYLPQYENGSTPDITFRAWDQTNGSFGNKVDTTTNGGTTAFSSATETATIVVTDVNDAPVLNAAHTPVLGSINEDAGLPVGAVGTLVSSLVDFQLPGGQVDNVADDDIGAQLGIAITGVNSANGTWYYSIDNGTNWQALGSVSDASARLLAANANTRIYFAPSLNYNGTINDAITFRAWDQSSGSNGSLVDTATNGGTTAFSVATDVLAITVTAINDAPNAVLDSAVAVEAGGTSNGTAGTNPTGNVLSNDTDVDTGETKTVTGVTAGVQASAVGSVASAVTGSYGSITIAADGTYTYTVDNNNATVQALRTSSNTITDVFTYTMRDTAGLTSTTQITVTIQGANDAPTIDNPTSVTLFTEGFENPNVTGETDTDPPGWTGGSHVGYIGIQDENSGNFTTPFGDQALSVYSYNPAYLELTTTSSILNATVQAGTTYNLTFNVARTSGQLHGDFTVELLAIAGNGDVTVLGSTSGLALQNDFSESGRVVFATSFNYSANVGERLAIRLSDDAVGAFSDTPLFDNIQLTASQNAFTITENSVAGAIVGAIDITDVDLGDTASFLLSDDAGGRFAINPTTGVITVAASNMLDFETSPTHDITVQVTDAAGATVSRVITITVLNTNEAPVLDNAGAMSFTTITEDQTSTAGNTVADIILSAGGNRITDPDSGAVEGIAITATTNGNGAWEYSTNGGTNWNGVGTVSSSSALLLRSTDLLRFVPNGQNATTGNITFRAWDQTAGNAGEKVITTVTGGTSAFSTATEVASITVTAFNDAPTITNSSLMNLTGTDENTISPTRTVSSLLTGVSWADVDTGAAQGIAITGITGNGTWQYFNGGVWTHFGSPSDNSSLLLNSSTSIRYQPDGLNGETATFSFRAWDQTTGTASSSGLPQYGNSSTNGGTNAYSSQSASAQMVVSAVNDAAVANSDSANADEAGGYANGTAGSNPSGNVLTNDTDVDVGDTFSVTGVAAGVISSAAGNVQTAVLGTYGSIQIAADGSYNYSVDNNNAVVQALRTSGQNVTDTFTYTIQDTGGAFSSTQIVITVCGANDAPDSIVDNAIAIEAGGYSNGISGTNPTGNVLANDIDVDDGDTKTVIGVAVGVQPSAAGSVADPITGSYGSISIAANGSYAYTVDNNNASVQALRTSSDTLQDVFTYTMRDAAGLTSTTQITVTVQGANDAPSGVDDSIVASEAGGVANGTAGTNPTGNVLTNDTDIDTGDTKTVSGVVVGTAASASGSVGTPLVGSYGTIQLASDGSYTYTVDNSNAAVQALRLSTDTLTERFTYTMTDDGGLTSTATLTITIEGLNDAPVAVANFGTATEAGGMNNNISGYDPSGNVLTNDTDVDAGDTKTVIGVAAGVQLSAVGAVNTTVTGTYGAIVIAADGSYTYTLNNSNAIVEALNAGQSISETFTYTIQDTAGATSTSTIEISIDGADDLPFAVVDFDVTEEAGGLENTTPGTTPTGNVFTNDVSSNGNTLVGVEAGVQGSAASNVNSAVSGLYGSITIDADGDYIYTLDNNLPAVEALRTSGDHLTDIFTYTFQDALGYFASTQITITLDGKNDTPESFNDVGYATESGGLNNASAGNDATGNVLSNDTDVDAGDTKSVMGVAAGASANALGNVGASINGTYGTIVLNNNGSYTYVINETNPLVQALRISGQTLDDLFTYTMEDTAGATSTATLTITIDGRNDNPLAVNDNVVALESGGINNGSAGSDATGNVLANDTDVDSVANGETKTVTGVAAGSQTSALGSVASPVAGTYGSINIAANGTLIYTIDNSNASVQALRTAGNTLQDVFTYTVTDGGGLTSSTQVTVTIQGNNDTPDVLSDSAEAIEAGGTANGSIGSNPTGNVLANDSDVDASDTLSVSGVVAGTQLSAVGSVGAAVAGAYGSLNIDSNGSYVYIVDNSNLAVQALRTNADILTDVFSYTAQDGSGATSTTQITLTIRGRNDAPVGFADNNDAYEAGGTNNGTSGSNATGNVISNDLEFDSGDTTAVSGVAAGIQTSTSGSVGSSVIGSYGSITIDGSGSYSYVVDESNGIVQALRLSTQTINDVFSYSIVDALGLSSTTQVTITIRGANDAPVAIADNNTAVESGGLNNASAGTNPSGNVLTNDTDVDSGDTKAVSGVSAGVQALAVGPAAAPVTGTFGSITIAVDGSYTYTVDNSNAAVQALRTPSDTLQDVFSYTMVDNAGLSSTTQITITIQGANDAPIGVADIVIAGEAGGLANGSGGTNPIGNVLNNDTDVDSGDTKTVIGVSAGVQTLAAGPVASPTTGTYGSIIVAADGSYTYTVDNSNATVQALRTIGDTLTEVFTYTMQDSDGLITTTQLTVTIQGANDAPHDLSTAGLSVAENASNMTGVGIISSSDIDATDVASYTLLDSAGGRFAIHSSTGLVTVADSSLLNYELVSSHSITVRVTDLGGASYDESFVVYLTDVNEFAVGSASDLDATTNVVDENASLGTLVGITATASDADATINTVTYSLFNNDGGNFAIDTNTGVVTTAAAINRETLGASRNITVRATSSDGSTSDTVFTININDLDEFDVGAVTDGNNASNGIHENAANGAIVGVQALAADADATTNTITYSLDDNAGGRFAINSSTGVVTVLDGSLLDYETTNSHGIVVRATSADTSFSIQNYTINLTDVNEGVVSAISDTDGAIDTVLENATIGTVVGVTASATDPDGSDTVSYSLDDDAGGRFTIHATTGVVTVAGAIDRETAASYDITIRATSSDSSTSTSTRTITIGDVDEFNVGVVTDSNGATNSVVENAVIGTVVGVQALAADADATTNTITYTLTDNDGGRFAIDASTGVVTVAGGIDRESHGSTRMITVRATSADSSYSEEIFSINIVDDDEFNVTAPTDVNASVNAIDENVAIGTVVGVQALAADADATTNSITYSLFDNDGGNFAIDANTGVVTTAAAINRESLGASRNIAVRATSVDGSTADTVFTININDLDEFDTSAVTDGNNASNGIHENAANGTIVGVQALAADADATTNTITYSLDDNAGGRFAIDSSTGVVTVLDGSLLDYETTTSHGIVIRATSADTSFSVQNYTINLTDVNESAVSAISDSDVASNYVLENTSAGTVVGITAFAADADGTDTVSYSLDNDAGGRFAIHATTGVVTVAGAIDRETAANYNITIRATSSDSSTSTSTRTIAIGDADEFDVSPTVDSNTGNDFVFENASVGTAVGITALADDPDGTDTVTYSLDDDAGGRFAIDATTGLVTVAGAIDREAAASYSITIRATSSDSSTSTFTSTILIGDVDEYDVGIISDLNAATNILAENSPTGTVVGITANATDVDATSNSVSYSLSNNAGGRFGIDSVTGLVTVADGSLLNFEASSNHVISVRATSVDGSYSLRDFTINLSDVNEKPYGSTDSYSVTYIDTLAASAANGLLVNDGDPDGNLLTAYLISGPSNGSFALRADGGFTYVPTAGFTGTVTFVYGVTDGVLQSDSITGSIVVSMPLGVPGGGSGGGASSSGSSSGSSSSSSSTSSSTSNSTDSNTTSDTNVPQTSGKILGDQTALNSNSTANSETGQTTATSIIAGPYVEVAQNGESHDGGDSSVTAKINSSITRGIITRNSSGSSESSFQNLGESFGRRNMERDDTSGFRELSTTGYRIESDDSKRSFFTTDSVVNTVLGTGMVIWIIQGAQILAAVLSTAPAMIQLDPLSVLPSVGTGKEEEEPESDMAGKLFDKRKI